MRIGGGVAAVWVAGVATGALTRAAFRAFRACEPQLPPAPPSVDPAPWDSGGTDQSSRQEWTDGAILAAVGGCHSRCPPLCHRCVCAEPSVCLVCKAAAYLVLQSDPRQPGGALRHGLCVHACPDRHAPRGRGTFNRHCVPAGQTLRGQVAMVIQSSRPGGARPAIRATKLGTRTALLANDAPGQVCACGARCLAGACTCNNRPSGAPVAPPPRGWCAVCTDGYYNYEGSCFRTCASIPGLVESGLAMIGRACLPARGNAQLST
mmetsp:Transcript_23279/g.69789  ORF Transcript_23279/g.69789 Transcript_23279/m.69789 type:complete len:264 (+) Transcript_23279:294-1085(+)